MLSLAFIYPKRLQSYDPTFINGLRKDGRTYVRTDGRTDKHSVYRTITFNRSCNVLKINPSGKTAYCAKGMPKQTTILNLNSISILGIPVTFFRHNGKCNICVFHEGIDAFEGQFFVRLSSLVLASEWIANRKKGFLFNRSISIDL